MQAMRTRRMSAQEHINNMTMSFQRQASILDHAMEDVRELPLPCSGPNPAAIPAAYVVGPAAGRQHTGSVICLHGFTCNGEMLAGELLPPLRRRHDARRLGGLRFVFLTAPTRTLTCYGGHQEHTAWHDYYTDHGGSEGRPDIEETIDVGQLVWSAAQVHAAMDAEAALLGGDMSRVGVVGQSQGSCTALHSVLTHSRDDVAGCFCSIGHLYSITPVRPAKKHLKIYTYNGAADDCIACCLSLRTYSMLLEAGFEHVRMHVEPHAGHEGSTEVEVDLLYEALEAWGLLS
jgi:predicted esterase